MYIWRVLPFPSNEIIIFNITLRSQAYKYRFWLHSFTPKIKTSILLSVIHSFLSILELRIWCWIKPCHLVDSLRTCKSPFYMKRYRYCEEKLIFGHSLKIPMMSYIPSLTNFRAKFPIYPTLKRAILKV